MYDSKLSGFGLLCWGGFRVAPQGLIDDLTIPSGLPRGRMRRTGNPKDVLAVVVTISPEVYSKNTRYGNGNGNYG